MGRDRGLAVEKMMEIYFFISVVSRPKVSVPHGAETLQINSCFTLRTKSSYFSFAVLF